MVETKKEIKYFTDQHGDEVIETVNSIFERNAELTEAIFITAPTMCGKSTFIKTCLCEYAKKYGHKILMLVPRNPIKQQFREEMLSTDIVRIETYQAFEKRNTKKLAEITGVYDIIVCDETHYFVSDSQFNRHTDKSFERMLKQAAVNIFMTATPEPVQNTIKQLFQEIEPDAKIYEFIGEGVSLLKDVKFFDGDFMVDGIDKILTEIDKTEDKAIIFCHNAAMAKDLYLQRQLQSMFVCSDSNKEYNGYMDKEARDKMLMEEHFDCKYLFCTSTMEMGVTLKDPKLKHIICTLHDWNSILQAMGRKRPFNGDLNDTFTLFLKDHDGHSVQGLLTQNTEALSHYNYLMRWGENEYIAEYAKNEDESHVVYFDMNDTEKIHPIIDKMILAKLQHERKQLKEIQGLPYKNANYKAWVYDMLGLTPYTKRKAYAVYKQLEALAGKKFGKAERKKIIDIIDCSNDNRRAYTGRDSLNKYLQEIGVNDIIVNQGTDKKSRRVYWYVSDQGGVKANETGKEASNRGTEKQDSGVCEGLLLQDTGRYSETLVS